MKKIILLSLVATLVLGCNKSDDDNTPVPELSIYPALNEMTFAADAYFAYCGGKHFVPIFTVTTNQPSWDVYAEPANGWCTVEKNPDGERFTVTALPNEWVESPQPATITVVAGRAEPINIIVKQFGASATVSIDPLVAELEFSADGQSAYANGSLISPDFTVTTNNSYWDVEVSPENSWCSVSKYNDNTGFSISARPNDSSEQPPLVTVTVTAGYASPIDIFVTQAADI